MLLYYYLDKANNVQGPLTLAQLQKMATSGAVGFGVQVCAEGGSDWQPLYSLPAASAPPPMTSSGVSQAAPRSAKLIIIAVAGLFLVGAAGVGFYGWNKHRAKLAAEAAAQAETKKMQLEAIEEFKKVMEIQSKVLDQLLRLNSICEMGTNKANYSSLLVQVKPEVDSLLRSYPSRADKDFEQYASAALDFYVQAQSDWEDAPVIWTKASGQIKLAALRRNLTTTTIAGILAFPQMGRELWTAYQDGTLDDDKLKAIAEKYKNEKSQFSKE